MGAAPRYGLGPSWRDLLARLGGLLAQLPTTPHLLPGRCHPSVGVRPALSLPSWSRLLQAAGPTSGLPAQETVGRSVLWSEPCPADEGQAGEQPDVTRGAVGEGWPFRSSGLFYQQAVCRQADPSFIHPFNPGHTPFFSNPAALT